MEGKLKTMIRVEPCKGCGAIILVGDIMGIQLRCDPAPLDAQEAIAALLAGRELSRVTYVGGRPANLSPARPAVLSALRTAEPSERPVVVGSHSCPAPNGSTPPLSVSWKVGGGTVPPKAPGAALPPKNRSSGQSTASSTRASAKPAAIRGSDPSCDRCGVPVPLDVRDRLVIIALGATPVSADHAGNCPGR